MDQELLKQLHKLEWVTKRRVNSLFSGEYHSAFRGKGIEFEEVRPYMPGDDVRDIDWNVSARTDELHIKRFREERELVTYILLDLSSSGLFSSLEKSKRDLASEITALLAFTAQSNQDKVGVIGFSGEVELLIPPGKGRKHVMVLLQKLMSHQVKGKGTSIASALNYLAKVQKRKSLVFLLSDFIDQNYYPALKALSGKHDITTFYLYDKREEELPKVGVIPFKDPESGEFHWINTSHRATRLEWEQNSLRKKKELFQNHHRIGVDHQDLDISGPWLKQLSHFFIQRQARRVH